jgi:hypothetical protein
VWPRPLAGWRSKLNGSGETAGPPIGKRTNLSERRSMRGIGKHLLCLGAVAIVPQRSIAENTD